MSRRAIISGSQTEKSHIYAIPTMNLTAIIYAHVIVTLVLSVVFVDGNTILDSITYRQNSAKPQLSPMLIPNASTIQQQIENPSDNETICNHSRKNLLELILLNHDKAVVPSNVTVDVDVEFTIQDIIEIHEMTSTFEVSCKINQGNSSDSASHKINCVYGCLTSSAQSWDGHSFIVK